MSTLRQILRRNNAQIRDNRADRIVKKIASSFEAKLFELSNKRSELEEAREALLDITVGKVQDIDSTSMVNDLLEIDSKLKVIEAEAKLVIASYRELVDPDSSTALREFEELEELVRRLEQLGIHAAAVRITEDENGNIAVQATVSEPDLEDSENSDEGESEEEESDKTNE